MTVPMVRIGEILKLRREPVVIEADVEYSRIGIYSWGKGFLHRPPVPGAEMGSLRYFTFPEGALVLSNIQAWEAAVAVSGPGERGYVASNRFLPYVPVENSAVSVDYLLHYFLSEEGLALLRRASPGTQVRNRTLGHKLFEDIEVPLPASIEQYRVAKHLRRMGHVSVRSLIDDAAHAHRIAMLLEGAVDRVSKSVSHPLGALLERERDWLEPRGDELYSPIGVRGFGRGIIHYPGVTRGELGKLRYYRVEPERILVSNIKAWEGAVTVTTEGDRGRIASNRFLQYRLTSDGTSIDWIRTYLLSRAGIAQLQDASPGSADRNRTLSMAAFEAIVVPVPSWKQQAAVLAIAGRATELASVRRRRLALAGAILPAVRNEVFSAMR